MEIVDFIDLQQALVSRIDFFHEGGCRISDHALDEVSYQETSIEEVSAIFKKRMTNSNNLTWEEIKKYKGFMLIFFGQEYAKRGWTQQYHINARRNLSTKSQKMIGVDSGFDGINDSMIVTKLVNILDQLEMLNGLPKTIFYSLNSKDNETLATICNCFNEKNIKGKMQLGSAWWFHDQKAGMMQQMTTLANMGLISNFVGMVTDSRSFLSYPRHDYFRRLLCNLFGNLIETGEYPNDLEFVGEIIKDICYNNAKNYFRLEL
jgi:glucuronate isomerase